MDTFTHKQLQQLISMKFNAVEIKDLLRYANGNSDTALEYANLINNIVDIGLNREDAMEMIEHNTLLPEERRYSREQMLELARGIKLEDDQSKASPFAAAHFAAKADETQALAAASSVSPFAAAKAAQPAAVASFKRGGKRKFYKHHKKTHRKHRTRKYRKPKSHKKRKSHSRRRHKTRR